MDTDLNNMDTDLNELIGFPSDVWERLEATTVEEQELMHAAADLGTWHQEGGA